MGQMSGSALTACSVTEHRGYSSNHSWRAGAQVPEEVEMRHGDLLRYVDQLKAALARVVAAYNVGLPSWQMADIAEKALGPTKE